jgi:hypothetical protein
VAAAATYNPRRRARAGQSPWLLAAAGCLGVAALSLLVIRQTTYDPTAWLIWGREIVHGDLSTRFGPSWKPLPAAVTAPSSLLGDSGQMAMWLLVARAGMLAAAVLAYRLAWRLEGPVAGVIAAVALLVSSGFLSRTFRGDSEGILVALSLGAVEAHLVRRRWLAFGLLVATALLRPEMCLFAGAYSAWLVVAAVPPRARSRTAAVVTAGGAAVVAAWLIPEEIGSGVLLRAASRALLPVAGSPATADFPFLATFTNAAPVLPWPLYAAGVVYVGLAVTGARRHGRALTIALAAAATALMVIVALMAEIGFTGNSRYLAVPVALTGILGAAGLVRIAAIARARLARGRATAAIAAGIVVVAAFYGLAVVRTVDQVRGGVHESEVQAALPGAVAAAGGRDAVRACGPIVAAWYDVQAVAWALHVHEGKVTLRATRPGTVFTRRALRLPADPRGAKRTVTDRWIIASTCRR